jgi:hypothetical protein
MLTFREIAGREEVKDVFLVVMIKFTLSFVIHGLSREDGDLDSYVYTKHLFFRSERNDSIIDFFDLLKESITNLRMNLF